MGRKLTTTEFDAWEARLEDAAEAIRDAGPVDRSEFDAEHEAYEAQLAAEGWTPCPNHEGKYRAEPGKTVCHVCEKLQWERRFR